MALAMPAVGAMAPGIAVMSVREIHKHKADAIFLPTGEFWVRPATLVAKSASSSRRAVLGSRARCRRLPSLVAG